MTTDRLRTPPLSDDFDRDFGIDARYGVTANLTADLTVNTDFAQVEVDEQQVNLTRFSLFFPEKRDFFLEGRGTFDFGARRRGRRRDAAARHDHGGRHAVSLLQPPHRPRRQPRDSRLPPAAA